jgi:hypothetical protein
MLIKRLQSSFEHSFADSFPIKTIIENTKQFISKIRPEISIDPITSLPAMSLKISPDSKQYSIEFIFNLINDIAKKTPTLVVIDEFQDIVNIDGAQSIFRNVFESLADIPIILMGSKKHILTRIFSNPEAPLAFWGEDIELPQIDFQDYYAYISDRFNMRKLAISYDDTMYLQKLMCRIPESINILCQQILEDYENKTISIDDINLSLKNVIAGKEARYESYLAYFTPGEERVCIEIAKSNSVKKPQGKEFVAKCKLTHRSIKKIFERFLDHGIIEKIDGSYRLTDPLLTFFLKTYR